MDCFSNLIGARGISSSSFSGLYLDQVGITNDVMGNLNPHYDSNEEFFNDMLDFASRDVSRKVITMLGKKLVSTPIKESVRIGRPKKNLELVAQDAGYKKGIQVIIEANDSHLKINLTKLYLSLQSSGNIDVEVYDVDENKLLDTITVTSVANQTTSLSVDKSYTSSRKRLHLAFLYNNVASIKTTTGCEGCGSLFSTKDRFTRTGAVKTNSASIIEDNLSSVSDTGGLGIEYNLECDFEAWVCSMRNYFSNAVLYKTAAEIIRKGLFSTRMSSWTTSKRDDLKETLEELESKYEQELESMLDAIPLPTNSDCFHCRKGQRNIMTV